MRKLPAVAILLTLLLSLPALPSLAEDAPDIPSLVISRACPAYPGEFITITNIGEAVDLAGWRISDGEGSVTFAAPLPLQGMASVTWGGADARFPELYPGEAWLPSGSLGLRSEGNLKLADAGDQVLLVDPSGRTVDVLVYGNAEPLPSWSGPPVACKKGLMLLRSADGTGPGCWEVRTPGVYSVGTPYWYAEVEPLLYPDDGLPALVREVDLARESIELACYIMENWTLARHLAAAAARGVAVTVLLEGQPVGGVSENGAAIAYHLQRAGTEVYVMRSSQSFRRYDYLHAKYVVFDHERLLVSSENMADSSFTCNRGWAAMITSGPLALEASAVFHRDLAGKGLDVFPLETSIAPTEGGPGRLLDIPSQRPVPVPASAALLTSPFEFGEALTLLLQGAQRRVLVQQLRIDEAWLDDDGVLRSLLSAAERGVCVRILLDSGQGTKEENARVAARLNEQAREGNWNLQCRLVGGSAGFDRLHNKGVIVDDTVLVGSANWVDTSMLENREMALSLRSEALARTFSDWFERDWKGDASPPEIALPWHFIEVAEGEAVALDATGCSDASGVANITWDLDGDGVPDLSGPVQAVRLPAGEHTICLTVEDALGNIAQETITVRVVPNEKGASAWLLYAPLPFLLLLPLLRRRNRRV